MLNKLTIALSAAIMLGAVSAASADAYDPWIAPERFVHATDDARQTFAFAPASSNVASQDYDPWIAPERFVHPTDDALRAFASAPAPSNVATQDYDPWVNPNL